MKKYHFCSLASRVRAGIDFLDQKLPQGIWYAGITEKDLQRLGMNSVVNDILSIVYGTSFPEATFDLGICGGETWQLGFNPFYGNPIESYKLDRLWKYAIKKCQQRTPEYYGLLSE